MRTNYLPSSICKVPARVAGVLLFAAAAFGQNTATVTPPPNFGAVLVGATSAAQIVTLTPDAMTALDPIPPASLTFSGAFALSSTYATDANSCAAGTAAGVACNIGVVFRPTAPVASAGSLTITATSSMTAVTIAGLPVALSGTGYALGVTPTTLTFGNVPVNLTSTSQLVTVSNTLPTGTTGGTNVDSLSFTFPASSPFSSATGGTCSGSLAPGNSCTQAVVFKPIATGTQAGQAMTVVASSSGSPVSVTGSPVSLNGTGYEPPVSAVTNGDLVTVTLTNTTSYPLTFVLAQPTGFTQVSGGTCASLTVTGTSCTVFEHVTVSGSPESGTLGVTTVSGTPVLPPSLPIGETAAPGAPVETGVEQVIQLTAAPTSITMPDGTNVPMWGYTCGTAIANTLAKCAKLNPNATGWSPVVITVPAGQDLEIELTNNLSFSTGSGTNNVPTSLVIVGQVGGGLGTVGSGCSGGATCTPATAFDHSNAQGIYTWVTANLGGTGTPPAQGPRVQSFATEVATGSTADLIWKNPRPGTYLLESGTHPSIQVPMGLVGMLVVTTAPTPTTAGTAYPAVTGSSPAPSYPAVTYNAEVPLEFSEIDPVQNNAVNAAVHTTGFSETAVWSARNTGPLTTVNIVYGGCGYNPGTTSATIVGANGSGATATLTFGATPNCPGGAVTGVNLTAQGSGYSGTTPANVLISDISTTPGSGAIITARTSPNSLGCGDPSVHTCYPPAVNYTPFYYLINGVAFNKTNAGASMFPATSGTSTSAVTGTVLARLVNAGLRMHVPSVVGSQTLGFNGAGAPATVGGFTLVAEDGNVVPNLLPNGNLPGQVAAPRVQTDLFMAAGKVYDVMVNAPASGTPAIPIYARDLALSANSSERDGGMLAYIGVNGGALPTTGVFASTATGVTANPDTYNSVVACPSAATSCTPLVVSDVSRGVTANDINVFGVQLAVAPAAGTLTCGATPGTQVPGLCSNGTFTYTPNAGTSSDSFTYCANGTTQTSMPSYCATVTLGAAAANLISHLTMNGVSYTAKAAGYISVPTPGVLSVDKDSLGYPLNVLTSTALSLNTCTSVSLQADGGFIATAATTATSCSFTYTATNNHGLTGTASVTVNFPAPSNLSVRVLDGLAYKACQGDSACIAALPNITDYRWVIEEDKTFYVNPNCTTTTTTSTAGCPTFGSTGGPQVPATFGVNFHTSHMDVVAQGCTSNAQGDQSCEQGQTQLGTPAVCEAGNGICAPGSARVPLLPSQVALNAFPGLPACTGTVTTNCAPFPKRFYLSVLPGDAGNPFIYGYGGNPVNCLPPTGQTYSTAPRSTQCGHGQAGAPISWNSVTNTWNPVIVVTEPTPNPPANLSVSVFEDDFPLNGEQDAGGGIDVIATNEPGLGGFEIILWDAFAEPGDVTGQLTHDMFNQPLSNSLAGTIDPATGLDACPVSAEITGNVLGAPGYTSSTPVQGGVAGPDQAQGALTGLSGRIVTCPKYESDGMTESPLVGQALVKNMMQGKYIAQAVPGASRIAAGEEWLQTNTLDGQHPHDAFLRIGEPSYFQEYGPAGYHVSIGFANPKAINTRHDGVCNGTDANLTATNCTNTVTGRVTAERMSRPPDQRLYSSGSRDAFYWTQCWVSLGDPDGEDFMFTKCDANGNFTFTSVPQGAWRITIGDQWNDQIIDGLSTPVNVCQTGSTATPGGASNCTANNFNLNMGDIGVQQWQANLYTRTCIDDNRNGICDSSELGVPLINNTVRYRDGMLANNLLTDFGGVANFNETFPLFNWYVVESDTTRYKTTGIHTVYDAGGPADGTTCGGSYPACGPAGTPYANLANTIDPYPLPAALSVPGAIYCNTADCSGQTYGTAVASSSSVSTGRIDPPWVPSEGWQGFTGQNNFIEFAKAPYADGENGGIHGHVVYASTRPFDDPQLLVQTQWTPLIPNVTLNLYQEGFAADGVTPTLTLVDTTQSSSWDKWSQGFRADGQPNMSCPGQAPAPTSSTGGDLFFYSLYNQPNWLNLYDYYYNGVALPTIPNNSQYKCYDAMHNWNQLQPAPYDGMYAFPSMLGSVPNSAHNNAAYPALTGGSGGVGTGSNFTPGNMPGTNCTVCVPNPDATDPWRVGTPMLPAGKYVVEVILPPGFELVKEEDKNILIGDNYIAPVYQQFGGLANIFILPDQASVASLYDESGSGYNNNNAQNSTTSMGAGQQSQFVPSYLEPVWPCVGQLRQVPDYMSLFPEAHQVAAFAGAQRHRCDRKEVTLGNQMSATAKFWLFTSTHIAAKFTGGITDDFTSEFDPFAPVFGEKFAPPNMPISTRDWAGNEISRVYSDQWGAYNGMVYSSWEVNPPNPTGYGPNTMVQCMNDKGPAIDFRTGSPTYGQLIVTDPLFTPLYSQFCYQLPYLPGTTEYLDTPVVPTTAFVGAGYNNADCAYPPNTPAISEVDGDGIGPYVSAAGNTITITALGDQIVNSYGYSGPQATSPPFNQKTVTRHYGFGAAAGTVTIGLRSATILSWSDTTIVATVPAGVPSCAVQQQAQYQGTLPTGTSPTALCGELVVTSANGQQSIDTVTVTVGGKAPYHVQASGSIQAAIDQAAPGDLIMVDPTCNAASGPVSCQQPSTGGATITSKIPSAHRELVIMWKPVRLQGVGAASSIIDAGTHPSGQYKLDPWRRTVNCLFGLSLNGQPIGSTIPNGGGTNTFDSTSTYSCPTPSGPTASGTGPNGNTWNFFYGGPNFPAMVVDRIPLEGILGWDATVNGNLAEQLQEPSLMGAYEGAGVTVLSKGVNIPAGSTDVYGSGAESTFPAGSTLLTGPVGPLGGAQLGDGNALCQTSATNPTNPYPSNFMCNPSSIDGMGITDASQGGGGIFVHGWGHNLQIANDRIFNNAGTLAGGIAINQGESPEAYLNPDTSSPSTCLSSSAAAGLPANSQLPYCLGININVHNNMITNNSSTGDELFTGTPAGAGGVSICTGSDWYDFNYNWVCGNISTGDAGGVGHLGFSWNGDIEHNNILFNQATNPSIVANGGGLMIMGAAPDSTLANGVECGSVTDNDCVPGLSDGIGPGLLINANLMQGNSADSGSGGGLRLQGVNGTDVARFPARPGLWYHVRVTNNIIANNVAGWDGAGISLEDALAVSIINNTIASNDTTASSGVLFNSLGAPLSSSQSPGPTCQAQNGGAVSCPQPAGLVSMQNSPQLTSSFTTGAITCPPGNYAPGTNPTSGNGPTSATCIHVSYPALYNNMIWQNRSFQIGVGASGTGQQNQQNVVTLFNANFAGGVGSAAVSQSATGACPAGSSYWDIGVRNDKGPGDHSGGYTLNPLYGVLTSATGYDASNASGNPNVISQYCNGSRVPPEATCISAAGLTVPCGWQVPPGISDAVVPNPVFSLTPAATVDEGNNWVNISWGPLSILNPVTSTSTTDVYLGNYALTQGSPYVDVIGLPENIGQSGVGNIVPPLTDFFGNPRPDPANPGKVDIGAVEFQGTNPGAAYTVTPDSIPFGNQTVGTASASQAVTITNTGNAALPISPINAGSVTGANPLQFTTPTTTCGPNLAVGSSCTVTIAFAPTSAGLKTANLNITVGGNALPPTTTVGLSGTGIGPTYSVSPTSLSFGNQQTGTTSAVQSVTVTNTSTNAVLALNAATRGGTNPLQFTAPTTNCPASLAAGASCTYSIAFAPTTTGTLSANLNINVGSGASPATTAVALSGTGVAPAFTLTPASLAFGNQADHTTSASKPVTLTNTGIGPLTVNTIANSTGAVLLFPETNNCGTLPATIAVGGTCTINVSFAPGVASGSDASAGNKAATLNVTATGAANQTVSLTGTTTTATVTFSLPTLTSSPANTSTKTGFVTVNVAAASTGPLTLTAAPTITRTGGATGTWSVISGGTCALNNPIAAGGSCTIQVQYVPSGTTNSTATVTITDVGATTTTQTTANITGN